MKATVLILMMAFILLFAACKKDKKVSQQPTNPTESVIPDDVSDAIEQTLESLPEDHTNLKDVSLPNGMNLFDFELQYDAEWLKSNKQYLPVEYQKLIVNGQTKVNANSEPATTAGPQAIKNALFARALIHATFLVTDNNFDNFLKSKNDTLQKSGLAYVYGSNDYTVQKAPSKGTCTEKLYGLDCSGMLTYILNHAGINISGTAAMLSDTSTWKVALKNAGKDFEKITASSYSSSEVPLNQIQSGDLMYFYDNQHAVVHIGIVLKNSSGKLRLFQSNGSHSNNCEANYGKKRGPREINIDNPITENWFKDYGILRLGADISGEYETFVKCTGESADALHLTMSIPVKKGGAFKANGNGIDYDGSPITAVLEGLYDKKTNALTSTFTFSFPNNPSDGRKDSFSSILNFDDTGYIPMTKVVNNGGCDLSIRLINQESKAKATTTTKTENSSKPKNCCLVHGVIAN